MRVNRDYTFNKSNYYLDTKDKHQIVIGNSYSDSIDYVKSWSNRVNGEYKTTVPYSIDVDGTVYKHYDSKYYSDFLHNDNDKFIIPINLINEGWLVEGDEKQYFNRFRCIYNREDSVINQEWRHKKIWAPYTKIQLDSLYDLCLFLSKKHNITLKSMTHNTKSNTVAQFNGITFKSNYDEFYRDVSPAFDFNYFLKKFI